MWLAIKNIVFAILVPGFAAAWLPVYIAGGFRTVREFGAPQLLGSLVLAAGLTLIFTAIGYFATVGRGTPAPFDPPRRLVIRGPHRYVRNPMYVGVVIAALGWALWFESWALVMYGGVFWLGTHLFVVLYEEPTLQRLFGADYEAYRAAVPRWLPRVPRS
jgi:protein-S-isoprenylcysteine O-methyltransferase Ste14